MYPVSMVTQCVRSSLVITKCVWSNTNMLPVCIVCYLYVPSGSVAVDLSVYMVCHQYVWFVTSMYLVCMGCHQYVPSVYGLSPVCAQCVSSVTSMYPVCMICHQCVPSVYNLSPVCIQCVWLSCVYGPSPV